MFALGKLINRLFLIVTYGLTTLTDRFILLVHHNKMLWKELCDQLFIRNAPADNIKELQCVVSSQGISPEPGHQVSSGVTTGLQRPHTSRQKNIQKNFIAQIHE